MGWPYDFLNNLRKIPQNENFDDEDSIIIWGDFNCPLTPILGKKGGTLLPRKSVIETIDCLKEENRNWFLPSVQAAMMVINTIHFFSQNLHKNKA